VAEELVNLGARPWQVNQVAPLIASALLETEPNETPVSVPIDTTTE
jgi:hypothetical protein